MIELVPRLNVEEIRGLFASPPCGKFFFPSHISRSLPLINSFSNLVFYVFWLSWLHHLFALQLAYISKLIRTYRFHILFLILLSFMYSEVHACHLLVLWKVCSFFPCRYESRAFISLIRSCCLLQQQIMFLCQVIVSFFTCWLMYFVKIFIFCISMCILILYIYPYVLLVICLKKLF